VFQEYLLQFQRVLSQMECSDTTGSFPFEQGVNTAIEVIAAVKRDGHKLLWVGNGGSAAIASHSAADYFRTGDIKTQCFSDASLLTCMGNDFGYPEIFARPVSIYAEAGDVLVAISSSGQSVNILNAVDSAIAKGCKVLSLSGFKADNPLRKKGNLNFYVPSAEYGYVELAHGILCHSFLDLFMKGSRCN